MTGGSFTRSKTLGGPKTFALTLAELNKGEFKTRDLSFQEILLRKGKTMTKKTHCTVPNKRNLSRENQASRRVLEE